MAKVGQQPGGETASPLTSRREATKPGAGRMVAVGMLLAYALFLARLASWHEEMGEEGRHRHFFGRQRSSAAAESGRVFSADSPPAAARLAQRTPSLPVRLTLGLLRRGIRGGIATAVQTARRQPGKAWAPAPARPNKNTKRAEWENV